MGLISLNDLQAHLQQTTTFSEKTQASALAAIEDASGAVLQFCERTSDSWTESTAPAAAQLVTKRLAARIYTNPQQRTSYAGPEGLNYQGGPVRLLTDDEREMLTPLKASTVRVGSIRMGVAPWMLPDNEAADTSS